MRQKRGKKVIVQGGKDDMEEKQGDKEGAADFFHPGAKV